MQQAIISSIFVENSVQLKKNQSYPLDVTSMTLKIDALPR